MSRHVRFWLAIALVGVGVIILGVVIIAQGNAPPTALALANTYSESPTAFSFKYPEGWQYQIPQLNLLILGEPKTLMQMEPGPTFTVQRSPTLFYEGGLGAALDAYLRRGPLRANRQWEVIDAEGKVIPADSETNGVVSGKVNGRDALIVDLQGSEFPDWPKLRMRIAATVANNNVVYIFVISAPFDEWEKHRPTLESIMDSVEILE